MKWSEVIDLKKKYNDSLEVTWITSLLKETRGNTSEAARLGKIDRSNFLRLIRDNGISAKEFRNV